MECSKWEQTGLLYAASELADAEKKAYEEHLASCEFCRTESQLYQKEKASLYTEANLGEQCPEFIDKTILQLSTKKKTIATNWGIFFTAFQRQPAAMLFLILGVCLGFYLMYFNPAKQQSVRATYKATTQQSPASSVTTQQPPTVAVSQKADSAKDSLRDSSQVPFSQRRGNISQQGVIPVGDLKR
jgi:hypothetical protein